MSLTAGPRSDYPSVRALLQGLLPSTHMLEHRDYKADWKPEVFEEREVTLFISSQKNHKVSIPHGEARHGERLGI